MTPTHRSSRLLRRVTRFALLVILGLVTTIGVAWGIEWFHRNAPVTSATASGSRFIPMLVDDHLYYVGVSKSLGRTERVWQPTMVFLDRDDDVFAQMAANGVLLEGRKHPVPLEYIDDYRPNWGRQPQRTRNPYMMGMRECASGFPMRCLWRWATPLEHGGMIELPAPPTGGMGGPGLSVPGLPYLPIPVGLIVNTIFWAGAWWGGLFGLTTFLRHRRLRAGHCPHCNYDLAGINSATCPECSHTFPPPDNLKD